MTMPSEIQCTFSFKSLCSTSSSRYEPFVLLCSLYNFSSPVSLFILAVLVVHSCSTAPGIFLCSVDVYFVCCNLKRCALSSKPASVLALICTVEDFKCMLHEILSPSMQQPNPV